MDPNSVFYKIISHIVLMNSTFLCAIAIVVGFSFGVFANLMVVTPDMIKIIGYFGKLFINMLKATVMLFIVITMMRTPMDMDEIKEAKAIGGLTILYSLVTSVMASVLAAVVTYFFFLYKTDALSCPPRFNMGRLATENVDDVSLLDSFLKIGEEGFPPNVLAAVVNDNILGVMVIFLLLGFLLSAYRETPGGKLVKSLLDVFYQVIGDLINLVIKFTPIGIFSLMSAQMSQMEDYCIFGELLFYLISFSTVALLQCFVVYPLLFLVIVRKNPFSHYRKFLRPITTAFATASSAAALPSGIESAKKCGIKESVINFFMPLGSTINMDGSSIYYPVTIYAIGIYGNYNFTIGKIVSLCFVSSIVTVGGAPVPSGALVFLYLVSNAVGITLAPDMVSLIWSIDPLMDRFLTAINVTGIAYGVKIVEVLCQMMEKQKSKRGEESEEIAMKKKIYREEMTRVLSNSVLSQANKLMKATERNKHTLDDENY